MNRVHIHAGEIDIYDKSLDLRLGSVLRGLMPVLLGPDWEDYVTVYIKEENRTATRLFDRWQIHNKDGPAVIKHDGTMEWWIDGTKLFVETQQEFECYMRNKAFW
jgi:hypothetical protein